MSFLGGSDGEETLYEYCDGVQPRKRQRLTHLSPGEKLQRRKLKNRVAAQAARDRRKAYMDELEDEVAQLKIANQRLMEENALLRTQRCPNCALNNDNVTSTTQSAKPAVTHSVSPASVKSEPTSKSAVLSPQQKDQVQTLLALMTILCYLTSQKNCSNCTPISKKMEVQRSAMEPLDLTSKTPVKEQLQSISQQWWGPKQSSWNPARTL